MDGSRPGELGVIAWCNSIRFTMAKEPGRQFLYEQIQREGFDWLDNYLEDFLDGPKKEPVIELLKTPGRKKNAPTRTRAATAAATAKSQLVMSLSFEDGVTKENREPINDFHKTLLQVKGKRDAEKDTRKPDLLRHPVRPSASSNKFKTPRIITITDSPAKGPETMEVDDARPYPSAPVFESTRSSFGALGADESHLIMEDSAKNLSIIAEDDEMADRSRISPSPAHQQDQDDGGIEPTKSNETVFHDAETEPSRDVDMEDEDLNDANELEQDAELMHDDVTSVSAATFHSIPLSPCEPEPESTFSRTAEFHTAPLPKVSLPPVPVEEEQSHTVPLPINNSYHEEFTMPLRTEPSAAIPGLSRKPSMPQFAGVPAPSPLRKSLRTPGEPTLTVGAAPSAPPTAVKRTSTSWLSKARETKALENTTKRTSTLGVGATTFSANNKRKSSEMLEIAKENAAAVLKSLEEEDERIAKVAKLSSYEEKGNGKAIDQESHRDGVAQQSTEVRAALTPALLEEDNDMLTTILKNHGARSGKSMGKSLGGNAAAALAEARARAEARVAERHQLELGSTADSEDVAMASEEQPAPKEPLAASTAASPKESERRLSVSDLIPPSQSKGKERGGDASATADTSISSTPPHTPPRTRTISFARPPGGPVFSKPLAPPPPPAGGQASARIDAPAPVRDFKLPTTNPFSIPTAMALGMGGPKFAPISAQSSKASIFSDIVFDRSNVSPAWMPSTQDTSYSAAQSQSQPKADDNDDLDADDSWGVDEKFAGNHMWTPFGFTSANPDQLKDDTLTWSTYPSQSTSQKGGDTGPIQPTESLLSSLPPSKGEEEEEEEREEVEPEPEQGFAERLAAAAHQPSDADDGDEADMAMEIDEEEPERDDLDDAILASKATIKLVQQPKPEPSCQPARSDSQQSMASTSSSQSNLGFFGHASKLVSSVLGGGKKGKPEVKSLQLAAAAAKKQQEEREKKAQRLKEMEARRQQAMQRKAEEEKARAAEEERKIKEEAERRKREREENTDKRPLRNTTAATKKNEDDTTKRKLGAPSSQKPPSKDKKDTALPRPAPSKPALKSALKQPTAGASNPVTPGAGKAPMKTVKHAPSSSNIKVPPPPPATGKGKERDVQEPNYPQPTRKAPGPPPQEPRVASESIELPDINSEYSDSEDEDRPKRDLPDWAKSPDIAAALQQQSTINPDDIFGRIGPLRMEEIFRTRHSRFRARTSSANWSGTDELTQAEEKEYAKRMGFK